MNSEIDWIGCLSSLVNDIDTAGFVNSLVRTMKLAIPLENLVIMMFRGNSRPVVLHDALDAREHDIFFRQYLRGGYLFSPYHQAWRHKADTGLYRWSDVTPEDFTNTEIYRDYYLQTGLVDEMGFLINLSNESAVFIGFGIYSREFTEDEFKTLRHIGPLLTACCYKHWQVIENVMPDASGLELQAHQKLEEAIENFGKSVLSQREAEIANMLMRGHTTRTAAEKLGISTGTVKNHRNSIYSKLDINSQSELFALFIQSVIYTDPGQHGDPLVTYLEPSRKGDA